MALEADESIAKQKALELEIERLLREVVSRDIMSIVQNPSVADTSNLQTELKHTLDSLSQKLENKSVELEFQDTTHGMSTNTKFAKQSILGKPPSSSIPKLYTVTPLPKSKAIPIETMSPQLLCQSQFTPYLSLPVSHPTESKVMKNDNVIFPGLFRINPFKASRVCHITGRMFDLKGNIITTSESEYQSDCFKGGQNWFDTLLIPLLSEYKPKDKEDHGDNECDT
ncbi:hypothetical protein Tco_1218549 [Tanacetum coccineum]